MPTNMLREQTGARASGGLARATLRGNPALLMCSSPVQRSMFCQLTQEGLGEGCPSCGLGGSGGSRAARSLG